MRTMAEHGCRTNQIVHANCGKCGVRPEVIHKPTNTRGTCYCGDCCPVCAKAGGGKAKPDALRALMASGEKAGNS